MNYSRLIFTIFSAVAGILVFAIWSNNNSNIYVYAQQSYSPSTALLSQLPQQTNSTGSGNNSRITTTTNVPIVLSPLPGGACPSGYHLVSGAVCIKDLPSAVLQTAPTTSIPTTTNTTKSFSIPPPSTTSQPNGTNPTSNDNNEENFNTKILKS